MLLFLTLLVVAILMQNFACAAWRTLGQSIRRRLVASDARKLTSTLLILLQFHRLSCILRLFRAPPDTLRPDHRLPIAAWATGPLLPPGMANAPPVQRENDLSFFPFYDWVV